MKTRTSVHPFPRPIVRAAGWLLLAITIWLFGSIASARAHALAAAIAPWPDMNSAAMADRIGGHAGTIIPSPSIVLGSDAAPSKDQS